MNISNAEKAKILSQALPYLQKYTGKVVVIKYGGNAMTSEDLKDTVMEDIVLLSLVGIQVVLVHGGGPEISQTLAAMNIPSRFVDGLRYTDQETMRVVQMVLAGGVNKDLVHRLTLCGGKAIGICGLDGGLLEAKPMDHDKDLGCVGDITKVNVDLLREQLDRGYIPVVASVAGDQQGNVYNINADLAAAEIAAALQAENISLMTDIRGLLVDREDESTLLSHVNINEVPSLISRGILSGGMIPKIQGCVAAIRKGVSRAFIIDGRVPHALLIEFFTQEGLGTMLSLNRNEKEETSERI